MLVSQHFNLLRGTDISNSLSFDNFQGIDPRSTIVCCARGDDENSRHKTVELKSHRYIQFTAFQFKIFIEDQNKEQKIQETAQFDCNEGSAKKSLYEAGPSN